MTSVLLPCMSYAGESDFILGAMMHFGHGKGMLSENLKVLNDGGMYSPREDIYWGHWERSKGKYTAPAPIASFIEQSLAANNNPLLVVGYANKLYDNGLYPKTDESVEAYAAFAENFVKMYKGRLKLFQVFNEYDGGCGFPETVKGQGDPASYMKLINAAYPRMKAVDPSITVIANSVTSGEKYLEATLKAGILKSCDGIAFHAYNYSNLKNRRTPEAWLERMKGVDQLIRSNNNGQAFPIYVTEIGWPNYIAKSGSTDAETGDFLARTLFLAKTLDSIKGLWWYDFQDDGLDPEVNEANFGIVRPDLTPKEAYYVIRSISEIIKNGKFIEQLKTEDEDLLALKFKMPDSSDILAVWSQAEDSTSQVTLRNTANRKAVLKCFLAGFPAEERNWGAREWVAKHPYRPDWQAPFFHEQFQFTVKGRPFIISGDLSGVEISKVIKNPFPESHRPKQSITRIPDQIGIALSSSSPSQDFVYHFGGIMNYRSIIASQEKKEGDLDASFYMRWDTDKISLHVDVIDDVFFQDSRDNDLWTGDSIQIAFQNFAPSQESDKGLATELTLALSKEGPKVFRQYSQIKAPDGLTPAIQLEVRRSGNKIAYTVTIPLKELGFENIKANTPFGFSMLVNDNDGGGRKGYLRWGDGIAAGKNPDKYNWIIIKD